MAMQVHKIPFKIDGSDGWMNLGNFRGSLRGLLLLGAEQ